jgi:hypothetical protein
VKGESLFALSLFRVFVMKSVVRTCTLAIPTDYLPKMPTVPVLIGVPYDASSSFQRGPAEAPGYIRQALWSESTNTWTESLRD